MNVRRVVLVAAALCAGASGSAWAKDREHMFLRGHWDPGYCWISQKDDSPRGGAALLTQPPTVITPAQSPRPSQIGDEITAMHLDPSLAVSPNYVLVITAHHYIFYDRKTGQPLVANGCVPVTNNFTVLFAPLLEPKTPDGKKNDNSINFHLEPEANPKYPCDPNDYLTKPGAPPSGCMQGNYDTRTYFDYDTRRFWIVAAARNHIYAPEPDARRYMFVAVSKEEDPRKGFWQYVLVRDYADWPLFSVRNKRLLLAHLNKAPRVYVFDAEKLMNGTTTDPFLGQYMDDAFPGVDRISLVTQFSDADGLSLILGSKGNDLTLYAFKDPKQPLQKTKVTLAAPPMIGGMQPVYRLTKLLMADDCRGACKTGSIEVHRLTTAMTGSPVSVKVTAQELFKIEDAKSDLRVPGVLVEEDGSALVWYQAAAPDGTAHAIRYNLLYPGDAKFRAAAVLRKSDVKPPNGLADVVGDRHVGGASEPGKLGFWITQAYYNKSGKKMQAVGLIKP